MSIDKILAGANAMLVRIGGLLHLQQEMHAGFRIGEIREVLTPQRTFRLRGNGRGDVSVDPMFEWRWRRMRGKADIRFDAEPNPHVMMVGMSGFGKSTLLAAMLEDIGTSRIPIILFDAHNEHESLVMGQGGEVYDASTMGLNLLELDGLTVAQRISELVGLFKGVFALGSIQCTKLESCLRYTYKKAGFRSVYDMRGMTVPTFKELMAELNVFINNARSASERNTLLHLKSKLQPLMGMSHGGSVNLNALMNGITSLSLAGLKNQEMRVVFVHELVKRLYVRMHENSKTGNVQLFIAIDEAEFMLGNGQGSSTIIGNIISEGRKYGVGVVMATHMLGMVDRQVVANASTLIAFYSREPGDINYVSNTLAGSMPERAAAIKQRMRKLRRGEVLLMSGIHRDVKVIRVEARKKIWHMDCHSESKDLLALATATKHAIEYDRLVSILGFRPNERQLSEAAVERGMFGFRGNSQNWVMKKNPSLSLEHEVRVAQISQMFANEGTTHYVLDNSLGPDIVAFEEGKRVAVEYETGKKRLAETAKMLKNRSMQYAKSIVYVKHVDMLRYEQAFSSSNVIIECVDCENGACTSNS